MKFGTHLNNYILVAVSIAAAVWFFIEYPSQDPRSAAQVSFTKKQIQSKAVQKLSDLGYLSRNFSVAGVHYKSKKKLLDSLQYQLGRRNFVHWSKQNENSNIKPFYWQVGFRPKNRVASSPSQNGPPGRDDEKKLQLIFDTNGKFIALVNTYDSFPKHKIQRSALRSVIKVNPDSANKPVLANASDSTMSRLLIIDLQKKHGSYAQYKPVPEKRVLWHFKHGYPYRYSVNDARSLADYYISQTGWASKSFKFDTVFVQRIHSMNTANVRYVSRNKKTGRQLQLNVGVAPTGALMHMNFSYPAKNNQGESSFIWGIIRAVVIFSLSLTGIIIFFFRIRSGALDIQSALVAGLVMGLVFPITIFLTRVTDLNFFSGSASFQQTILLFMIMGFAAAFVSVGYFMLFAIADSLTRQYWPQKLSTYDYLRQGKIFNKPFGNMMLRAIAFAFILCGFWTFILWIFPHAYLSTSTVFFNARAVWSPLLLVLKDSWFSLVIVLSMFLVVGSLTYGKTNNKWLTALAAMIGCGILVPVIMNLGPSTYQFLTGALLGGALAVIYIGWDFLTLLFGYFIYLCLLGSASGWVIPHSPDKFIFIIVLVMIGIFALVGLFAIYTGAEERTLPEYVPGYVEELAQEQRIKQELEIAREVQQSFLPSRIPAIPGLDISAICQPANETGGDYYDFIPLDDHRVAVAIGDVSGKGIQAAFYMTLVKGMLHSLCRETDSPAEVLIKANRLFYENATKSTFVSLIYGIVDIRERTFTFARAGHNPLLHFRESLHSVEELQPNGLGLGLTKAKIFDNKIQEIKLSITEDDLFLLYTDGIVEALNQAHQFYGTENLISLIKKQHSHSSAAEIVSAVSKAVNRFIGPAKQHDDMTLMAIRFSASN
ncbi:MAG TPA: SpoIIE family protein phosphatase [Balneolaceae bacterium]|nr:SpoIIE family protein phosphatase [Balneolaceae bacterium]